MGVAFCIYHMPHFETPALVTADFAYFRFHGAEPVYIGRYTTDELKRWAELIRQYLGEGLDVYAYFNNDANGNSAFNAGELRALVGG